jgi:hypothetical protein
MNYDKETLLQMVDLYPFDIDEFLLSFTDVRDVDHGFKRF